MLLKQHLQRQVGTLEMCQQRRKAISMSEPPLQFQTQSWSELSQMGKEAQDMDPAASVMGIRVCKVARQTQVIPNGTVLKQGIE